MRSGPLLHTTAERINWAVFSKIRIKQHQFNQISLFRKLMRSLAKFSLRARICYRCCYVSICYYDIIMSTLIKELSGSIPGIDGPVTFRTSTLSIVLVPYQIFSAKFIFGPPCWGPSVTPKPSLDSRRVDFWVAFWSWVTLLEEQCTIVATRVTTDADGCHIRMA